MHLTVALRDSAGARERLGILPDFAFWLATQATAPKFPLLALEINLDVDAGRVETGVTKPGPDRVNVVPGTQLMSSGGSVGREPAVGRQAARAPPASDDC